MSDIDLSQPIFQNQYACSERNSVPDPSSSEPHNPSHPPQAQPYNKNQIILLKPGPSYRLSQNTISKWTSPVKINTSLLKSQQNPFSSFDPVDKPDDRKTNASFLASISQSDTFECQHKLHMNSVCEICKGKGFLKGDNNLIRFFQYIIGFKFGINQSYSAVRLLKRKRTEVNNFCSQFFTKGEEQQIRGTVNNCGFQISSKSNRSSHGVPSKSNLLAGTNHGVNLSSSLRITNPKSNGQSLTNMGRMSLKSTKKCNKDELMDQINNTLAIHEDYVCDVCEVQPIVGARFHCNDCEDFDLCGDCYRKGAHQHMMQKIEKSAKGTQLQNVVNFLIKPQNSSMRISLRPPPNIEQVTKPLTSKSAIR